MLLPVSHNVRSTSEPRPGRTGMVAATWPGSNDNISGCLGPNYVRGFTAVYCTEIRMCRLELPVTKWLISWSRAPERLTAAQLAKKFRALCWKPMADYCVHHISARPYLEAGNFISNLPTVCLSCILILSSNLGLIFLSSLPFTFSDQNTVWGRRF
jgi:hypothetical protein